MTDTNKLAKYRLNYSADDIFDIMAAFECLKEHVGFSKNQAKIYAKLDVYTYGIQRGTKTPDYVNKTDVSVERGITLEKLGATVTDKERIERMGEEEEIATYAQMNHEIATGIKLQLKEFRRGGSMFNKVEGIDRVEEDGTITPFVSSAVPVPVTPTSPPEPISDTSGATQFTADEFGNILSPTDVDKNNDIYANMFGKPNSDIKPTDL